MTRLLYAALLGFALSPLLWGFDYWHMEAPVAARVYGDVMVIMPEGTRRPLKAEEYVQLGAKIDTGEKGEVLLALQPGIAIKLGINTRAYVSSWTPPPAVDRKKAPPLANQTPQAPTTITLMRGTLFAAVESDAYLLRQLTVMTRFGEFICTSGSFSLTNLMDYVDVTTLHGFLNIDSRLDKSKLLAEQQITLGGARHLVIGPERNVTEVKLLEAGDPMKFFSSSANALMEGVTYGILSPGVVAQMAQNLSEVGRAGDIQVPVIVNIGQQLAGLVTAGRVSPIVAGQFIREVQTRGISVGKETLQEIEQAIVNAPPPQSLKLTPIQFPMPAPGPPGPPHP